MVGPSSVQAAKKSIREAKNSFFIEFELPQQVTNFSIEFN
jgi:hypothetical protein